MFDDKGIKTIYEENEGNHFQNADLRMAKGIKWILEQNEFEILYKNWNDSHLVKKCG